MRSDDKPNPSPFFYLVRREFLTLHDVAVEALDPTCSVLRPELGRRFRLLQSVLTIKRTSEDYGLSRPARPSLEHRDPALAAERPFQVHARRDLLVLEGLELRNRGVALEVRIRDQDSR